MQQNFMIAQKNKLPKKIFKVGNKHYIVLFQLKMILIILNCHERNLYY